MMAAFVRAISRHLAFVLTIAFLTGLAGCQKSNTSTTSSSKRANIDACSLITNDEVQKIQGSPIKDVKGSANADGSFRIAQRFYTAETFSKSVSVAVTQANPTSTNAHDSRDFWKQTFGRFGGEAKEGEGDTEKKESLEEHEEREGGRPPKKIEGIGDAACWTANRMGGALYVLKDDVFVRISVGGPDTEDTLINRCKALAEKALSRL